ncbi:probable ribonuclease 11 [Dipodomys spectabilis]|uniref:probable ribonuclease 11 n=1 Tax=Dipodomys spectabilis TaxID=105255 RepID=UPI001C5355CE|nr:probable ribonuclease 11 [Dipodomys spectabilis]
METFVLLLLGLGLVLTGASGNILEIMKEEFAKEEMQSSVAKSGHLEQTVEVLMNFTLFDQNTSMSKVFPSSLLTFRRSHFSTPKGNILGNHQECCNITVWRKLLEANRSCRLRNNFIPGTMEVTHHGHTAPGCECGQNPIMNIWESPEVENTMCQLSTGRQSNRCQYHRVTSLKKMFTVLTGHSLMSWLVSGSKL